MTQLPDEAGRERANPAPDVSASFPSKAMRLRVDLYGFLSRYAARLSGAGARRVTAFVVTCAILPALFRILHMAENGNIFRLIDLRGLAADMGVGAFAAMLLLHLRRAGMIALLVGCLLWLTLNTGYYEFLRQFGSPYALAHASFLADKTFVEGSAISFSHPVLLIFLGACLAVTAVRCHRNGPLPDVRWLAAASAVAIIPHLIPGSPKMSEWRQTDLVFANVGDIAKRVFSRGNTGSAMKAAEVVWPSFKADLDGKRWLVAKGRPNVLLVFMESVSGGHIPSLAASAGMQSDIAMPRLDAIGKDGIFFTRFVTLQNQSNRGVYAALCGDLPQFINGVPKMTQIANGAPRPCLPAFLAKAAGYHSAFLKSANSNFMQMREFGLKTGFDRVYGEEADPSDLPRGPWGLYDDGLYKVSLDEIDRLKNEGGPWFLTLFTSGTHHPFSVPPGAVADGATARQRAWDFADRTVSDFISTLKQRGVLSNTLVIITSDEAGYVGGQASRSEDRLTSLPENWGFAVVLAPGAEPRRVPTYAMQSDLALSILDYLDISEGDDRVSGRSMFRAYATSREIPFASVYHRRVHLFDPGAGELTMCSEDLSGCRLYKAPGGDLFSVGVSAVRDLDSAPASLRLFDDYSLELPVFPPAGS